MERLITNSGLHIGQWLTDEAISKCPEQSFSKGIISALKYFQVNGLTCTNENAEDVSTGENAYLLLVDGIDEFQVGLDWRQIIKPYSPGNGGPDHSAAATIVCLLARYADHLPGWFSLLMTCRRQNRSHIQRLFPWAKRVSIDDLHKPTVGHDIQQYILARLRREERLQTALRDHFNAELLSLLRIKSSACMLYLETILDMISDQRMTAHHLLLVPGTLNGLYLWICQNLPYSERKLYTSRQHHFEHLKVILNVLLVSPGIFTEEELYRVLATFNPSLSFREYQHQLLCLRNLLVLEVVSQKLDRANIYSTDISQSVSVKDQGVLKVIQFNHISFAEWILDIKHCTGTFLCDISKGEAIIRQALKQSTIQNDGAHLPPRLQSHFIQLLTSSARSNQDEHGQQHQEDRKCQLHPNQIPSPVDCGARLQVYDETDSIDAKMAHIQVKTSVDSCELPPQGYSAGPVEVPDALIIAVRSGRMKDVAALLNSMHHLDINRLDEDGWSALRTAAWRGYSSILNLLLIHGADVNLTGGDGRSALRAAAWSGHVEIVRRLLETGACVDQEDAEGRTPLIAAAYMGHAAVVELLAQAGANLNHADEDGRTALHVAAFCVKSNETVYHEVVSCLLEYGANASLADSEGVTPLLGAARLGNRDVCELCLEADTDVNQTDRSGNTALMLAVLNGHVDVVRLLLFWGGAVDVMDSSGRSLLCIAALMGELGIVHELITRGLDEAHRDHRGCTPLHLAVIAAADADTAPIYDPVAVTEATPEDGCQRSVNKYYEVIRLLIDSGACLEVADNSGRTPLLIACEANQLELVKAMLTPLTLTSGDMPDEALVQCNGADSLLTDPVKGAAGGDFFYSTSPPPEALNQACMEGHTPLRLAALSENFELARLLLSAGADPDQQDSYGRTTLYLLALEGMLEMADLFLHTPSPGIRRRPSSMTGLKGANPVLSDDEGRCPLHVATWQGHLKMVRLLLKAGTPVDIRDREGRTPLQLAAWQGHADICSCLLTEGNARVDAVCSQGATSLCIAAQEGNINVCRVLLQAGANPYQVDGHGRTPFRVASKAGHLAICRILDSSCNPAPAEVGQAALTDSNPAKGKQAHASAPMEDKRSPYLHQQPAQVCELARSAVDTRNSSVGAHYPQPQPTAAPATAVAVVVSSQAVPGKVAYQDDVNPYAKPVGPVHQRQTVQSTSQARLYNPVVVTGGQPARLAQVLPWQPVPVCSGQLTQVVDPTAIQLVAAYQPGASFQMDPQKICFVPMVNCTATGTISPLQANQSIWSFQQYKDGVVPLMSDRPLMLRDGFDHREDSTGGMLGDQSSRPGANPPSAEAILEPKVIDSNTEAPLYEFQDSRYWPSNLPLPNKPAQEWSQVLPNQVGHHQDQTQLQVCQLQTPGNHTNQSRPEHFRVFSSTSADVGRARCMASQAIVVDSQAAVSNIGISHDSTYRQRVVVPPHTGNANTQVNQPVPPSVAASPLQNVNKFASSTKSAIAGMFGLKCKRDRRAQQKATSPLGRQPTTGPIPSDHFTGGCTPEVPLDPSHKYAAAAQKIKEALPPKPPPHRQGRFNKCAVANPASTQPSHPSVITRQPLDQISHYSPPMTENRHDASVHVMSPAIHGNESRFLQTSMAAQRRTDYPENITSTNESREYLVPTEMKHFNPFNRSRSHPCPKSP